jgi:type IV secretion system protein VirD4
VTESQSRIRALEDSANVSRRSEERPLISANELLRFPLDEVLVLPEGQYPIRAQHVRYYEDRWFGPIEQARKGVVLRALKFKMPVSNTAEVAMLTNFTTSSDAGSALRDSTAAFHHLSQTAKTRFRKGSA